MTDQVLYGKADEYLYDLIETNFGVNLSDNMLYQIFEAIPEEKRSYDDITWLAVAKYFIENGTYGKVVGEILYAPMLGMPNLYAGRYKNEFIEQDTNFNQLEIKYYIYADIENNVLHVMPFTPNEKNKADFFNSPEFLKRKEEHQLFTKNFKTIGLTLKNSTIIYYGIDKEELIEKIQTYKYNEKENLYEVEVNEALYQPMFKEEVDKEIQQLKAKD